MDVTDGGSIQAAVAHVSERLAGGNLDGLVNIAGIGLAAPLEYASQDDLRRLFDVNVFGQLAVTQAFLPHAAPIARAHRQHELGRRAHRDPVRWRAQRVQGGVRDAE